MKKRLVSLFIVLVLVVSILPYPSPILAASQVPKEVLVLGDSISTGYGLAGYTGNPNAVENFGNMIKSDSGANVKNLAVDGDTSGDFLAKIVESGGDTNTINGIKNADVILVSIGGNDVLGLLLSDIKGALGLSENATGQEIQIALSNPANQGDLLTLIVSLLNGIGTDKYMNAIGQFAVNFQSIVGRIRTLNPNAQLCFQTMYNPFNDNSDPTLSPLFTPLSTFTELMISLMNATINAGAGTSYIALDTYTSFKDNALTYTNIGSFDIHPNATGHEKIAEMIADKVDLTPNAVEDRITSDQYAIYANGYPVIITAGTDEASTLIYLDENNNGVKDNADTLIELNEPTGNTTDGYDLSQYLIFGGSEKNVVKNTDITMLGGTIRMLVGGGYNGSVQGDANTTMSGGTVDAYVIGGGLSNSALVTGNTNILITGGVVARIVGGGMDGAVAGNTNISITGGAMHSDVYGGGAIGTVTGNTNVSITGGMLDCNVYGGALIGNVTGVATTKIGVDAVISGSIYAGGREEGSTVGVGSAVYFEVAFYDDTQSYGKDTPQKSIFVKENEKATKPDDPKKAGLDFVSWLDKDNHKFDFSSKITSPNKLYASWDVIIRSITYYDGNEKITNLTPSTHTYGTETGLPIPQKTGYTFEGWYLAKDLSGDKQTTVKAEVDTSLTYYAKWTIKEIITPSGPELSGDNSIKGWEALTGKIKKANNGDEISIDMKGTTVIPQSVLEEMKGKDITLILDMGNGITWTIKGKDITGEDLSDVNLDVLTNSEGIPVDVINNVTGKGSSLQLKLEHSGEFGFKARLTIGLGSENTGLYANLFYYNPTTKKLEFVCYGKIDSNGNAKLEFSHASNYLIVIDQNVLDGILDDKNSLEENTDNIIKSSLEADNKTEIKGTTNTVSSNTADTGDVGAPIGMIVLLCVSGILLISLAIAKKKRKN